MTVALRTDSAVVPGAPTGPARLGRPDDRLRATRDPSRPKNVGLCFMGPGSRTLRVLARDDSRGNKARAPHPNGAAA